MASKAQTELAVARTRIAELEYDLDECSGKLKAHVEKTKKYEEAAVHHQGRAEELEKALRRQDKRLEEAEVERVRLERNLSRALGYIDRVLEAERPETVHHSVGDVYAEVSNHRGPQMEEPPFNGGRGF